VPVLALALAACAHRAKVVAPTPTPALPPTTPAIAAAPAKVLPEPAVAAPLRPDTGVVGTELPADLEQLNRAGFVKDAFFDTDKAELREDARQVLAEDAAWLKQHAGVQLTLEGHCDERNTEEYNLALGWRRANVVKAYLATLGVSGGRMTTISYGEERPFALGHDESAWAQNRRVHFVITGR
jgi:peptidoglycan-associated lipoprotein